MAPLKRRHFLTGFFDRTLTTLTVSGYGGQSKLKRATTRVAALFLLPLAVIYL